MLTINKSTFYLTTPHASLALISFQLLSLSLSKAHALHLKTAPLNPPMTIFSSRQVVPMDYESEISQRLVDACLVGDMKLAIDCISDSFVDVNYIGAVTLTTKKTEVVLKEENACEVKVECEELKTDVTALFVAVHHGHTALVKKLLSVGADVNQKLFRGFVTTAAVREGHLEILKILIKAGAAQPACEEALLEASCHGQARFVEMLMGSDLIRPHVAVHSLVTACCRGFTDVVDVLMKCGVDQNVKDRALLQSSVPALHTNVDCPPLVAAVVSRQVSVVRTLLQAGVKADILVSLGAWSWDTATGEELRVGVGLAEPYAITWCAVEYFEASGRILRMLLEHFSPNTPYKGRTLLHHAILCANYGPVKVLLSRGCNVEAPVTTTTKIEFRPIHMAARLGLSIILQCLIDSGCDLNSRTESGNTALMICAKLRHENCLTVLAMAGADFGLVNNSGQSANSIAEVNKWSLGFQQGVLDAMRAGKIPKSSNVSVFCPLIFAAQVGDVEALKTLISMGEADLDYQDCNGLSALMITALKGHVEAFRLLVYAGANMELCNKSGENAMTLYKLNQKCDLFEKVMLEFTLEKGCQNASGFNALHCAARCGDLDAVKLLIGKGYDINAPDGDGYTPLMLAAREGHGRICEFLLSHGARSDNQNARGETALSLSRTNRAKSGDAESVILDELARKLVLRGSQVQKHTKGGKATPHLKDIRMIGGVGVLQWGKSNKKNVICRDAAVGPSPTLCKNRQNKGDANIPGIFRIVTTKNKEVHFVCEGGLEMAELWVRGIKLVTRVAICGTERKCE